MVKKRKKKERPLKMPPIDYPPEYSHPSLGVRPARESIPIDAQTHAKINETVLNALPVDEKQYAGFITNLFEDMVHQGLPIKKGSNDVYYWHPKEGSVTRFANDRDLIEDFAGSGLYPDGNFPVVKLQELTPKQARILAEAYTREGDRYAASSKKGDIKIALGSYANAEHIYEMLVQSAPVNLEGTKRTLADLNKKYQQTLEKLGPPRNKGLEGKIIPMIITIASIGAGLFFLSNNITGNVIGLLNTPTSNIIGAILLLAGLTGAFFWFKNR